MADPQSKTEPCDVMAALELELRQKRANWHRSTSRYRLMRGLSFFFLFLVLAGSALAFFYVFSQHSQRSTHQDEDVSMSEPGR
jgi:hypothetical protein